MAILKTFMLYFFLHASAFQSPPQIMRRKDWEPGSNPLEKVWALHRSETKNGTLGFELKFLVLSGGFPPLVGTPNPPWGPWGLRGFLLRAVGD
jgi:hypothetical protein